jgi:DNA-binding response OmpR family regulator
LPQARQAKAKFKPGLCADLNRPQPAIEVLTMKDELIRLLLVEEDPTLADITSFRLELLGYAVNTVHTGEQALESALKEPPDLIILDLYLPGLDGVALIQQLRSEVETANVPVLVFSVDSDPDQVQRAYQTGASDYLVTPYDPAVLEQKLIRLIENVVSAT